MKAPSHRSNLPAKGRIGSGRKPRWVLKWLGEPADRSLREFLRSDIAGLCSLSHPLLALPTSFGIDPATGRAYVLRAHVPGAEILSAARGSGPKDLLPWLVAAAEALEVLHRFGFLHRNVKASNLIVSRNALLSRPRRENQVILCDPSCLPEEAGASPARDLRDLGEVFYQLLTGHELERGAGKFAAPPSSLQRDLDLDLERLLLKLLHPDPARGYQRADSLVADLRRLAGGRAPPIPLPADCFLDRREELARAVETLEEALRKPTVLAVKGQAGMGKSAFLRRIALEAQLSGLRTVSVRCYPEGRVPSAPLRQLVQDLGGGILPAHSLRPSYRTLLRRNMADSPGGEEPLQHSFIKTLMDLASDVAEACPTVLVVDEAHLADPLTVEFLSSLAGEILKGLVEGKAFRALPSLAIAYRTEPPFLAALRPLLDVLRCGGDSYLAIELRPFGEDIVEEWLELARFPGGAEGNRSASRLRGHPFALRELIRMGGLPPDRSRPGSGEELSAIHSRYLDSLGHAGKDILEALAVLGRPAAPGLIAKLLGIPESRLRSSLGPMVRDGILSEEAGRLFYRHGSFPGWILQGLPEGSRKALHRKIASRLRGGKGDGVVEVARHWLHSDVPEKGTAASLSAARHLVLSGQGRSALTFYQSALQHLPQEKRRLYRSIEEEAAEAYSRAGDYRRAVEIMSRLLDSSRSGGETGRLHGKMGVYCHRGGEVPRAVRHLEKGLRLLAASRYLARLRERMRMQSELAEIFNTSGNYQRAEALCRQALGELEAVPGARKDLEVRRQEMLIFGTLAHLRLRSFHFAEARELFERSYRLGKALRPARETSLVLNNLGTLHAQENRIPEAIHCFERAGTLSAQMGDDQSLSIIHSNLSVLHARSGDPDAADRALACAEEHEARCDSSRIRFLRLHSAGLVDLAFGRYSSSIEAFKAAILLGEELGDLHLVAFELVFLGECRLFRGEGKAATTAFGRALGLATTPSSPIPSMVAARRAALAALRGNFRGARTALAAEGSRSCGIAYVDAWNRVFRGWARRLLGYHDEARGELEEAREFFSLTRVPCGEMQACLELAMAEGESGEPGRARRRLETLAIDYPCGKGPLKNSMLSARLLAYQAKLLLADAHPNFEEAANLLMEAESHLIGRKLPDLEALAAELRERLPRSGAGAPGPPALPAPGPSPSGLGEGNGKVPRPSLAAAGGADVIVGKSPSIRRLIGQIRQAAPSRLPVLITGETGAGKDLVAVAIHRESSRRAQPLVSLNCAAMPGELLEAQLFGYLRGAFSGAEEDHPGLLWRANGGTLLFDEISEMPLHLQAKLLRVLDSGRLRPLGGEAEVAVDVRYLFATNGDVTALLQEGRFRRDLFFRIKGFEIHVPPLRERLEDLPLLVGHFRALAGAGDSPLRFDEPALRAFASHPWPGNIRELKNVVTRLVLTCVEKVGEREARAALERTTAGQTFPSALLRSRPLEALLRLLESEYLTQLHADRAGDLESMAAVLGITVRALYDRFKRLGLRVRELKEGEGSPSDPGSRGRRRI